MTSMKPKGTIKLDIVELDKSEIHLGEEVLPKDVLYRYLYQPGEQYRDKKEELLTLSVVKIYIG